MKHASAGRAASLTGLQSRAEVGVEGEGAGRTRVGREAREDGLAAGALGDVREVDEHGGEPERGLVGGRSG